MSGGLLAKRKRSHSTPASDSEGSFIDHGDEGELFILLDGKGDFSFRQGKIVHKQMKALGLDVVLASALPDDYAYEGYTVIYVVSEGVSDKDKVLLYLKKALGDAFSSAKDSLALLANPIEILRQLKSSQSFNHEKFILKEDKVLAPVPSREEAPTTATLQSWRSSSQSDVRKLPQYACQRSTTLKDHGKNLVIINVFEQLLKFVTSYPAGGYVHSRHKVSLLRVLSTIKWWRNKIKCGSELKAVKYVSTKWMNTIDEILRTGTCERLEHFKRNQEYVVCRHFCRIHGCGPSTALKWYENGFRSVSDIRDYVNSLSSSVPSGLGAAGEGRSQGSPMNMKGTKNSKVKEISPAIMDVIAVGLPYFEDMQAPFPLESRLHLAGKIARILSPLGLKHEVCGGTRRLKPEGHDIDILFTLIDKTCPMDVKHMRNKVISMLKQKFYKVIELRSALEVNKSSGALPNEYHGPALTIIKELENSTARRVDLIIVPQAHWPFATLGWSGSQFFQRSIRQYVKDEFKLNCSNHRPQGNGERWILSQKCLARVLMVGNTTKILERKYFGTEKELMEFIGLKYLEPFEREC